MDTPGHGHNSDSDADKISVEETVVFEGAPPTGAMDQPKKSFAGPGLFILVGCIIGLVIVLALFR